LAIEEDAPYRSGESCAAFSNKLGLVASIVMTIATIFCDRANIDSLIGFTKVVLFKDKTRLGTDFLLEIGANFFDQKT
jgi:hypothetical protein